jgi:hypothetical protein
MTFTLAILCLGFTWRRQRREHMILIATALLVIVPYIPFYLDYRYILPAVFTYLIWIGLGVDLLLERASRYRERLSEPATSPEPFVVLAWKMPRRNTTKLTGVSSRAVAR